MAAVRIGKIAFKPCGAFNIATAYEVLDTVTYLGSMYIAKGTTTGNLPTDIIYFMKCADEGKSAYQSAQDGGYIGDETKFNTDLGNVGNISALLDAINGEVI